MGEERLRDEPVRTSAWESSNQCGSRPSDKGVCVGGGGGGSSKKLFSAPWASVSSKNNGGGGGPPLDPPLVIHGNQV